MMTPSQALAAAYAEWLTTLSPVTPEMPYATNDPSQYAEGCEVVSATDEDQRRLFEMQKAALLDLETALVASALGWKDQLRIPQGNGKRSGRWTFTPWAHLDELISLIGNQPEIVVAQDRLNGYNRNNFDVRDADFNAAVAQAAKDLDGVAGAEDVQQALRDWAETDWSLFAEDSDIGRYDDTIITKKRGRWQWNEALPPETPVNPAYADWTSQRLVDRLDEIANHHTAPSPKMRRDRTEIMQELNDRKAGGETTTNWDSRVAALEPYAETGPNYIRSVADELNTAKRLKRDGRDEEAEHFLKNAETALQRAKPTPAPTPTPDAPTSIVVMKHPDAVNPSTATRNPDGSITVVLPNGRAETISGRKGMTHALIRRNGGPGKPNKYTPPAGGYFISLAGSEEKALKEGQVQVYDRTHIEVVPILDPAASTPEPKPTPDPVKQVRQKALSRIVPVDRALADPDLTDDQRAALELLAQSPDGLSESDLSERLHGGDGTLAKLDAVMKPLEGKSYVVPQRWGDSKTYLARPAEGPPLTSPRPPEIPLATEDEDRLREKDLKWDKGWRPTMKNPHDPEDINGWGDAAYDKPSSEYIALAELFQSMRNGNPQGAVSMETTLQKAADLARAAGEPGIGELLDIAKWGVENGDPTTVRTAFEQVLWQGRTTPVVATKADANWISGFGMGATSYANQVKIKRFNEWASYQAQGLETQADLHRLLKDMEANVPTAYPNDPQMARRFKSMQQKDIEAALVASEPDAAPTAAISRAYGIVDTPEWHEAINALGDKILPDAESPLYERYGTVPEERRTPQAVIKDIGKFYSIRALGNNCVLASNAYELRRRGIDAEPKQAAKGRNAEYSQRLWYRNPEFKTVEGLKGLQKKNRSKTVYKHVADHYPPGSRGTIRCGWKGRSFGHIWNWEVHEDGEVVFYDAQTGKIVPPDSSYWFDMEWDGVKTARLDNLRLLEDIEVLIEPSVKEMSAEERVLAEKYAELRERMGVLARSGQYNSEYEALAAQADEIRKRLKTIADSYEILHPEVNTLAALKGGKK